jgi:hypothetical protein
MRRRIDEEAFRRIPFNGDLTNSLGRTRVTGREREREQCVLELSQLTSATGNLQASERLSTEPAAYVPRPLPNRLKQNKNS